MMTQENETPGRRTHPKHSAIMKEQRKTRREIARNRSEYRTVWTIVMFDMPVKTKEDRKNYCVFRKSMLQLGFEMFQFSIYTKFAPNNELNEFMVRGIQSILPPRGKVSILSVTGIQFGKMQTYFGPVKKRRIPEPEQLLLF